MDGMADALGVSTGVVLLLAVLMAVQLALQIYGLLDLARRPAVAGGRKWVWLLVILFLNLVGAVLYLAVGRKADTPLDEQHDPALRQPSTARAADAVDLLYGPKDDR